MKGLHDWLIRDYFSSFYDAYFSCTVPAVAQQLFLISCHSGAPVLSSERPPSHRSPTFYPPDRLCPSCRADLGSALGTVPTGFA